MHALSRQLVLAALGATLAHPAYSQNLPNSGLLNESGTSILAPALAPAGGYAANPQEYLQVAWTVSENASDVYTYSYTLQNPAGDVLLNNDGSATKSPEVFEAFSVAFNTAAPGAFLTGSQTGGAFQEANSSDLAWFFAPAVSAGGNTSLSFQSDMAPMSGNASVQGAAGPAPWSSFSANGQQLPVPDPAVVQTPEPSTMALLLFAPLLTLPFLLKREPAKVRVKMTKR